MSPPRVEVIWWAGCPSTDEAMAILRERMAAAGLDAASIVSTEVTSEAQARELGFPGSPTILIGGADVQDPGDNPIGLSCRVYRRRDGRVSPLPDPADIAEALERAREGEP